ncbi:MAG TPA: hypothetical protein VF306_14190 [Pirellulales bacterium]
MSQGFQYSLRALLLFMLVVAAFFGGMAIQRQLDEPILVQSRPTLRHSKETGFIYGLRRETIRLRDGTKWERTTGEPVTEYGIAPSLSSGGSGE